MHCTVLLQVSSILKVNRFIGCYVVPFWTNQSTDTNYQLLHCFRVDLSGLKYPLQNLEVTGRLLPLDVLKVDIFLERMNVRTVNLSRTIKRLFTSLEGGWGGWGGLGDSMSSRGEQTCGSVLRDSMFPWGKHAFG